MLNTSPPTDNTSSDNPTDGTNGTDGTNPTNVTNGTNETNPTNGTNETDGLQNDSLESLKNAIETCQIENKLLLNLIISYVISHECECSKKFLKFKKLINYDQKRIKILTNTLDRLKHQNK